MKVYTIDDRRVYRGAMMNAKSVNQPAQYRTLYLGGGSNGKEIPLFNKNPAEVLCGSGMPWGGVLKEAHPVEIRDGVALAKPNRDSDRILVVVKTRDASGREGCKRQMGVWNFDYTSTPTCEVSDQIVTQATGPKDYYSRQDDMNIGWHDALIVMKVGDVITTTDQNGFTVRAKYASVEQGLKQE